ncbi:sugar-binding protein, partial [Kitasatospora sp. NPDC049258]
MSRERAAGRRFRTRSAAVLAAALVGSLLPTLPLAVGAAAADYTKPSAVSPEKPVKGSAGTVKDRKADTTVSTPAAKQTAWPTPGSSRIQVPAEAGKAVKAGELPVSLAAAGTQAAKDADVQVLSQDLARKAGISGVLLSVSAPQTAEGTRAKVSVDYSAFAQAGGAGFGSRLRLVQLPACVLTTPDRPECRVQTPLPGGNDPEHQTVTADAVAIAAPLPVGGMSLQSAGGGATVLAATAGTAGPSGDYKATPLSSASTWSTQLSSGSFAWNYDMPLTAMPGGLTPKLALSYNSGSVDGRSANTNNQASWVGDGFDLSPGFVERSYKACADDGAPKTGANKPG